MSETTHQISPEYQSWIAEKIRNLSVEALSLKALICNACGEVEGIYIIEYQDQTLRLSSESTLAFLEFILSKKKL